MNTKINSGLYQVVNAVILSGIILMFLGTYYCVIKAGIPYQDPPLELQIQYIVNMKIGETLLKNGLLTILCSGSVRLVLVWKTKNVGCKK